MQEQIAVLLDFNGTLNNQGGYCHPDKLEVSSWAVQAIRRLNDHGLPVTIVTNQSGVADGKFSLRELQDCFQRILVLLEIQRAHLEAIYYCPHAKEDKCSYKKPSPKMLIEAAKNLSVKAENCLMVGDTGYSDMQAGYNAGCKLILVQTGNGKGSLEIPEYRKSWQHITPDFVAKDVLEAAQWICSSLPKQKWNHQETKLVML